MKLTGVDKAAILLIILGQETSSKVLKLLPERAIKDISYKIAEIEYVELEEREKVIKDFTQLLTAKKYILDGGIEYARDLLNKSLGGPRAKEITDMLSQMQQREKPFAIARKADTQQLTNLLIGEHPQTTALIMCYMQPDKAAEVLTNFPIELQSEIAERIGTISTTSPTVIARIEKIMEDKFTSISDSDMEAIGGVETLVDILNSVDRGTEKNIISVLEENEPELAEDVKANLFVFEDIVTLDSNSIQRILRDVDNDVLILALKGVSEDVADVIYKNMSTRAASIVMEELEIMGPVRLTNVEEAQRKIVDIIRKLDEKSEIVISRGGGQDSIIV